VIYLDHNATTSVSQSVFEAMAPFFVSEWGNPSSTYRFGARLKSIIETARDQVASLIGSQASEIVFVSCGTEANNTAIASALKANPTRRHIITSQVEHSSILNHCQALEREGFRVTYLPVGSEGLISLADLTEAIDNETAVVSLMWANNETGVIFPVEEIAKACHAKGVLYHCDAIQAAGKIRIDVSTFPVNYLSITAHKFHGPKGIGALFVRRRTPFVPYVYGGHQERNRRGGTENVPYIVGMGLAAKLAASNVPHYSTRVRPLRDMLESKILSEIPLTRLNGHKELRICNTSSISFHGVESEALLILLDKVGVCASSGSACLADSEEPSHVIAAMNPETAIARQTIRFSLDSSNTEDEVRKVAESVRQAVETLRS
jgi:cysteine desulfurase